MKALSPAGTVGVTTTQPTATTVGISIADVAQVVTDLEIAALEQERLSKREKAEALARCACSVSKVRYLLVLSRIATDAAVHQRGVTRSFPAADVALVRLALRLERQGVSPVVARVVLGCLRDRLVEYWAEGLPLALAIRGVRGELLYEGQGQPEGTLAWVPLRDVWRGVHEAMKTRRSPVRRGRPRKGSR